MNKFQIDDEVVFIKYSSDEWERQFKVEIGMVGQVVEVTSMDVGVRYSHGYVVYSSHHQVKTKKQIHSDQFNKKMEDLITS